MEKRKAVFMDFDHTIVRPKNGAKFAQDNNDWEFIDGVLPIMRRFNELGYLILIVSNQGGIELGYNTVNGYTQKVQDVINAARSHGVLIHNFMFSTTNDTQDNMRKPNPGMAEIFQSMYNLDLSKSIMVGDMDTDEGFATNAEISEYYHIDKFLNLKI